MPKTGLTRKAAVTYTEDDKNLELPFPVSAPVIDFNLPKFSDSKDEEVEGTMHYRDSEGNTATQQVTLKLQGSSSIMFLYKNQTISLPKKHQIRFGSWIADRKFHLKKYYIDAFRGQSCVGYKIVEDCYQTLPEGHRRPWQDESFTGIRTESLASHALAHPDGFPVWVRLNGTDMGLYALCLRKNNDNYLLDDSMDKEGATHIMLDGALGTDTFWKGNIQWNQFEVRCPDGLYQYTADGTSKPYDGDHPGEILPCPTKTAIENLANNVAGITQGANLAMNILTGMATANETTDEIIGKARVRMAEVIDLRYLTDYFIISQALWHFDEFRKNWIWITYDGKKWFVTFYNMDALFGQTATGVGVGGESEVNGLYSSSINPSRPSGQLWWLFQDEVKNRYKELRENGVLTTRHIIDRLEEWQNAIGEELYAREFSAEICPETPSFRENNLQGPWILWNDYANSKVPGKDFLIGDEYKAGDYVYAESTLSPTQQFTLQATEDLTGCRRSTTGKGVNIVRTGDGTIRKVFTKTTNHGQ